MNTATVVLGASYLTGAIMWFEWWVTEWSDARTVGAVEGRRRTAACAILATPVWIIPAVMFAVPRIASLLKAFLEKAEARR